MEGLKNIWSVGGGKGGPGKSLLCANMGALLALKGMDVIVVDADMGGGGLHTYFGIKCPERGLVDFIKGRVRDIGEVAVETGVKGLRLISGGGEFPGIANPALERGGIVPEIKGLGAERIIVDLGAGASYDVLDFFGSSNKGIVVIVPLPAAVENAYLFLKGFVYRALTRLFSGDAAITALVKGSTDPAKAGSVKSFGELLDRISEEDRDAAQRALQAIKGFRPGVLLNMTASKEDMRFVDAFRDAARTYLSVETDFIGHLSVSPAVKDSARGMPFVLGDSAKKERGEIEEILENLLRMERRTGASSGDSVSAGGGAPEAVQAAPPAPPPPRRAPFGFNDNIEHMGTIFHVQTEVRTGENPVIETVIYHGGRVYFSKKTAWAEALKGRESREGLREFAVRQHKTAIAAVRMDKISVKGVEK